MSNKAGRVFRMNDLENYSEHVTSYKTSRENVYFTYNGFRATNAYKTVEEEVFLEEFNKEPEPIKNRDYLFEENLVVLMNEFLEKTSKNGIEIIFVHSLKMSPTAYNSRSEERRVGNDSRSR